MINRAKAARRMSRVPTGALAYATIVERDAAVIACEIVDLR